MRQFDGVMEIYKAVEAIDPKDVFDGKITQLPQTSDQITFMKLLTGKLLGYIDKGLDLKKVSQWATPIIKFSYLLDDSNAITLINKILCKDDYSRAGVRGSITFTFVNAPEWPDWSKKYSDIIFE